MRRPVAQAKGLIRATEAQQTEIAMYQRRTLDGLERFEEEERGRLRCAAAADARALKLGRECPCTVQCRFPGHHCMPAVRMRHNRRECLFTKRCRS